MGVDRVVASVWTGPQAIDALDWVRPLIEQAVAYDPMETTVEAIYEDVFQRRSFVWVVLDESDPEESRGFILGSFYVLRGMKEFVLSHAGGNIEYLLRHLEVIEDFARQNGASKMKIPGRMGWLRVLKAKGYSPRTVILSKDLEVFH